MTDYILANIIAESVDKAMISSEDTITRGLADGLQLGDHVDPITVKLIIKSMRLTAQLTAQITIQFLKTYGCIELPPDDTPLLRVLDEG